MVTLGLCDLRLRRGALAGRPVAERRERGLDQAAVANAITEQIAAIHEETYDTRVKQATTHVLDDLVVVLLDIELSAIERRMAAFGRGALVHELRHAVQQEEEPTFTAAVERATGRRVTSFASHTHLDPPFVAELFRLAR